MQRFVVFGIDEMYRAISVPKLQRNLQVELGVAVKQLHRNLEYVINSTYHSPYKLDVKFINGNVISNSNKETAKRFLSSGLVYKQAYADLSKFPYYFFDGNINPGARRTGKVHRAAQFRGRYHTIVGKRHHGGFVPRKKNQAATRFGKHGAQMLERVTDRKQPLTLLLGPSLFSMLERASRNPRLNRFYINLQQKLEQALVK